MPNLTAGQSATIDIPAGMPCYVSTTQDAYVDLVAGAPGSGYTSDRLVGGRAGKLYGPWTTPAKITIRSVLGTATYGGAYAGDPIDLGQKSAAAIVAINAAIAAGTASYPAASTVVNTDTGARWTLSGLGTAAAFAVDGAGNSAALATLRSTLVGQSDQIIYLAGDSTGNEVSEWFYKMLVGLLPMLPTGTYVSYRLYVDTTGRYSNKIVLQTGAGEPGVTVGSDGRGWGATLSEIGNNSQDLDLVVDVKLDAWAGVAEQTLIAQFGNPGNRAYRFYVDTNSNLRLDYSVDGTSTVAVASSVSLGYAAGARAFVRASFDGDNGAGGATTTFATSVDGGETWVTLGATQTSAGVVASLYTPPGQTIEVGSRGSANGGDQGGAVAPGKGTYYQASVSNTLGGGSRLPAAIRDLNDFAGMIGGRVGGPAITVFNGSIAGASMTYLADVVRSDKMTPRALGALIFISSSHNEGAVYSPSVTVAALTSLRARIEAKNKFPRYFLTTQNPRKSPATQNSIAAQAGRASLYRQYAGSNFWGLIDSYLAFSDHLDWIQADGIHPAPGGSDAWAVVALRALAA